jgi:pyruvate dehydrogenase E2 component (dihydrolipoamide acetyltransferase)
MAKILDMPKLSPTMEEGVLATWHKKEGDAIQVDDLLAEVETDKATMEFRAFDKGTLLKLLVDAGASVKLGQPVAILGNPGEDVSDLVAQAGGQATQAPQPAAKPPPKEEEGDDAAPKEKEERPVETPRSPPAQAAPRPVPKGDLLTRTERDAGPLSHPREDAGTPSRANGERPLASPYVRKIARERGVDLASARGSGDHGRILPSDLDRVRTREPAPMIKAPAAGELAEPEARPLSQMRKAIARRLTQSKQTVPHFYLTIDVDAGPLAALREEINAQLADGKRPEGEKPEKISLNDLIIKAAAAALVRVPECNAQFTDEAILVHKRVDISVAVAVPDGLLTPVVRNADQKSVVAIGREVRDLAARARAKKLKPEEMGDGTFSISNLGMFGIDAFSAVINPPEGAILAVGQARDEPVVQNGAVVPGKKLAMTLSCDHRVVDGAVGAAFLAELRALVEHPMRILTG